MTTENSTPIEVTDDLDAFSEEMFGKPNKVETPSDDAEDTSSEEDALANQEQDTETDADPDDNDGDDEDIVEKPKKQTAQERIQEINAKFRESERRAIELERKIKELEAPKVEVKTPTNVSGEPGPDDLNEDGTEKYPLGEFDGKLAADRAQYHVDKRWAELQEEQVAKASAEAQKTAMAEQAQYWEAKLVEAESGELPDIREDAVTIVNEFSNLDEQYGNYLASTLMSLDKGPEVLNYLATNMDEARKIVAMGPTKATIALGRLEARFLTEGDGKVKPKVSAAPEPPKNLNRGAGGKFVVPDDTDDLEAFEAKFFTKRK